MKRYWELSEQETIDFYDSLGKEKETFRLPLGDVLQAQVMVKERAEKGQIAGIAGIRKHKLLPLLHIVVKSEFQGRGVGRRLMEKLHQATVRQCSYIVLSVAKKNGPAMNLFKQFGYRSIGQKGDTEYMIRAVSTKGNVASFFLKRVLFLMP